MVISLNGLDNSGKTTQANILLERYPNIFPYKFHINDMTNFDKEKFNFDWWFSKDNTFEFVNSIYKCLEERIKIALELNQKNKIIILEKGLDFYETRIISTLIVKGVSLKEAIYLNNIVKSNYELFDIEDIKFYLLPGNYKNKDNFSLDRREMYDEYLNINAFLLKYFNIPYTYISSDSVDNVTNNILDVINERTDVFERKLVKKIS